jgi:hypothetical protein
VEGPEHRGPKPFVDARDCNDQSRTSAIASDVLATTGISQSRHSRRIVPMTRSQIEFAVGLRGGLFNTRSPSRLTD